MNDWGIPVDVKRMHEEAKFPYKSKEEDSCYDLTATSIEYLGAGKWIVGCGWAMEPSKGFKLLIVPRSSITKTSFIIQNSPCQIDENYRGEFLTVFQALPKSFSDVESNVVGKCGQSITYPQFPYKVGDRYAQMYIERVLECNFREVSELTETERNDGGFGSSGL